MFVDYRRLLPGEESALIDLWVEELGQTREVRRSLLTDFGSAVRYHERTYVAVTPDGAILAAAAYWPRMRRDSRGIPERVGHIWGVTTRSFARRQGHASRLLALLVAEMQCDGCRWSLLNPSWEARPLYERHGWSSFTLPCRRVALPTHRSPRSLPYIIERYDPARNSSGWANLGAVYSSYNAARPFTVVRDEGYWRGHATWRFNYFAARQRAVVFVATRAERPGEICGYVLAHLYDEEFVVTELGVLPDESATILALLWSVVEAMQGGRRGRVFMPYEAEIDTALASIFPRVDTEYVETGYVDAGDRDDGLMLRPIAPDVDERYLKTLINAAGAGAWVVDGF